MELTTLWFCLIAFLWVGYFVLEGFDFGVGLLVGLLGRSDRERRLVINTIGPVWDGNEVWLIVAAGATFAAFPEWYATLFSGFYLPLLMILVSLILRNVAFDYRGKRTDPAWRRRWDWCIIAGSAVPALLWGVLFGNLVRGVPIDADGEYVGGLADLVNPFALLAGLVTLTVFLTHGAVFLALKTDGEIRGRARRLATRVGVLAVALAVIMLAWANLQAEAVVGWVLAGVAAAGLIGGLVANTAGREGWAFLGTAAAIVAIFSNLFVILFPNVMPSSLDPAWSLTVTNAASTPYTLTIMTWAALFATPVVLAYQGWTYWVFRKRLTLASIPEDQHAH
ncbi:cytochrome d ubiquinol oxidase subunit II [Microlunatus parietis]|uniref:Cytochrome d ubiquinol oxidase subunit II n=1 Tax=Microlunatus parietis TaxID=682979 RepID=A0A7Y9I8R3_9ACTN|nr:cytochrome d ubiquinol oxidase subunit II [Microlunatus parietis]NYE72393.1 cytochrome d ubiquinol oxidase subunit II [Microlunatus parietis]